MAASPVALNAELAARVPRARECSEIISGRRFQCPHCNKCYASYDCLSRHKRIHTGANKKTCPTCFRLFFRADHFKTHTSTCSKKQSTSPQSSATLPTTSTVTTAPHPASQLPEKKARGPATESGTYPGTMDNVFDVQYRPSEYVWATQLIDKLHSRSGRMGIQAPSPGLLVPRITNISSGVCGSVEM